MGNLLSGDGIGRATGRPGSGLTNTNNFKLRLTDNIVMGPHLTGGGLARA